MSPSRPSAGATSDSLSGTSREEVRERYLAECEANRRGGPAPDLDALLSVFLEPERSEFRAELESVEQPASPGAATTELNQRDIATVEHTPAPASPSGTVDFSPAASPEMTVDLPPRPADGTLDHVPGPLGETMEHSFEPGDSLERSASEAERAAGAPIPKTVAGYEVLRVLGRGAMGVVYKARQRGLKRIVALKMILAGAHASEHDLARFRSEAEAVAQLQHVNIVQIYEVGEEEGRPFFSLEYVDGISLDRKARGTPLKPKEAAGLAQQMAEAMDYAHKNGVVHRDLKPANVLLTSGGIPKISDFGLAKRLEDDSAQTRSGTILGTPSYMPPEQAEGRTQDCGPLSDVYSLGAILYEMLTGRPPFRGATILDTLQQVRTQEPVAPTQFQPGVPADLETICLKSLQKEAGKRYSSAGALAEDLRRFLAGEPILARPVGRIERAWRWCRRNPKIAALSATIALLVAVWAVTSSILAWNLNLEKNRAEEQTEIAKTNAAEAVKQTGIAKTNEAEAIKQTGIAKTNEAEANKQTTIAESREKRAKKTADETLNAMLTLAGNMHNRLQSKRLSINSGADARKAREDLLNMLRQSLSALSAKIEAVGTSEFGNVAAAAGLGDLFLKLGQPLEAQRAFQQGYDLIKKLSDADPKNDRARGNLAIMLQRLGDIELELRGDAREARIRYVAAGELLQDIFERPRSKQFTVPEIKRALSHNGIHLGKAQLSLGDPAAARKTFLQSLAYREEWLKAEPNSPEARGYTVEARVWLGAVAWRLGDSSGMEENFKIAVTIMEGLEKESPKFADFKADLADLKGEYGDGLMRTGKLEDALKYYKQALDNIEAFYNLKPDDLSKLGLLAQTHERLGTVYGLLSRPADAGKHFQDALALRSDLYEIERGSLSRQAAFVLAMARAGKHAAAANAAGQVRPRMNQSTELMLQLARCYALCSALDANKAGQYTNSALEALRAAIRVDYRDLVSLQSDPALTALRGAAAFQDILAQLKTK